MAASHVEDRVHVWRSALVPGHIGKMRNPEGLRRRRHSLFVADQKDLNLWIQLPPGGDSVALSVLIRPRKGFGAVNRVSILGARCQACLLSELLEQLGTLRSQPPVQVGFDHSVLIQIIDHPQVLRLEIAGQEVLAGGTLTMGLPTAISIEDLKQPHGRVLAEATTVLQATSWMPS